MRRRLEAATGLGVLSAVAGVAGLVDPHRPGALPTCPVRALTGLICPGCGSLRAVHDLVHGRWLEAVDHNAVFTVAVAGAALLWIVTLARPEPARWRVARPELTWAALLGLLVWTVLRNLPVAPFNSWAP